MVTIEIIKFVMLRRMVMRNRLGNEVVRLLLLLLAGFDGDSAAQLVVTIVSNRRRRCEAASGDGRVVSENEVVEIHGLRLRRSILRSAQLGDATGGILRC